MTYEIDELDRVIEAPEFGQSCTVSPWPLVLAGESLLVLTYYMSHDQPEGSAQLVFVTSSGCSLHFMGLPNDEALAGHPLARRGLEWYGAYRVENSSLVRLMERRNSVHPGHDRVKDRLLQRQHHIFKFKENTFECVTNGLNTLIEGIEPADRIPRMMELFRSL
ncbi:MAG: hypothetical protein ACAH95_07110 [Fimbriimonas sp.]